MKQPTILYNVIKINDGNVLNFVDDDSDIIFGETDKTAGKITIYRYVVEHISDARLRSAMYEVAENIKSKEPITRAHEMRHWHLYQKHGMPEDIAKNYFELTALHTMEEVSAYSAGFLYADPCMKNLNYNKVEKIIIAMHAATELYKDSCAGYLKQQSLQIKSILLSELAKNTISFDDLRKMRDAGKNSALDLYSPRFQSVLKSYLTFDGICVYDEKTIPTRLQFLWDIVKNNIQEIKSRCEKNVLTALDEMINIDDLFYMMNYVKDSNNKPRKK